MRAQRGKFRRPRRGQRAYGVYAALPKHGGGLGPEAPKPGDIQRREKSLQPGLPHHHQSVRFFQVGSDLGRGLGRGQPYGAGQGGHGFHPCLELPAGFHRPAEQMRAARDVQESLIDAHLLQVGREFAEDFADAGRSFFVFIKTWLEENALRTAAPGFGDGHGRVHAEFARLIGTGGHHAPPAAALRVGPYNDGPAFERGVVPHLDGREESVHVHVYDAPFHSEILLKISR